MEKVSPRPRFGLWLSMLLALLLGVGCSSGSDSPPPTSDGEDDIEAEDLGDEPGDDAGNDPDGDPGDGSDADSDGDPDPPDDPDDPSEPLFETISVRRDAWGVPHVFAESDAGAMFGVGYAMAEDRFFQMSWLRILARGESAAFFGAGPNGEYLAIDRKARLFGMRRHAERAAQLLEGDAREWLAAFTRGVNRWLASPDRVLHPWFDLYAIPVEEWTPADAILLWNRVGFVFSGDPLKEAEVLREFEELVAKLGSEALALEELFSTTVVDEPAAVVQLEDVDAKRLDEIYAFANLHGVGGSGPSEAGGPTFSHVSAVGSARSASGEALLHADPRAGLFAPSSFYEYHARGATMELHGAALVGSPRLLAGRTANVSWGVTSMVADQADLFRLRADEPGHAGEYLLDGEWRPFELEEPETLEVLGGPDEQLVYRETLFGPVVSGVVPGAGLEEAFALRSIGLEGRAGFGGFPRLARAESARTFGEALETWKFPSVNIVMADEMGSIGYWATGEVPIRAPSSVVDGRIAQDGTRSDSNWVTLIPHRLMPWVIDPPAGVLFSANHLPVGTWYPLPLGLATNGAGDTSRSRRLRELFQGAGVLDGQVLIGIHADTVHPDRRDYVRLGLYLRDEQGVTFSQEARAALLHLEPWFRSGASMAAEHYGVACAASIDLSFRRHTAGPLVDEYGAAENGRQAFMKAQIALMEGPAPGALSDAAVAYIDQQLAGAWTAVLKSAGPPSAWADWYTDQLSSPLETWTSFEQMPSLAPGEVLDPGTRMCTDSGTLLSQPDQSYSMFSVPGSPVGATSLMPPGQAEPQSAHAGQHSTDQLVPWVEASSKPAPLDSGGIEALGPVIELVLTWQPDLDG